MLAQRQIEAADRPGVYGLYRLTAAETAIVEEATNRWALRML